MKRNLLPLLLTVDEDEDEESNTADLSTHPRQSIIAPNIIALQQLCFTSDFIHCLLHLELFPKKLLLESAAIWKNT